MRLKNLISERKIPDIYYSDGMIGYRPTGVEYDKDILFNLRPNEWKEEILRRIQERKVYAEFMEKLEILVKDTSFA